MFQTKRSLTAQLVIVVLCVFFLVNLLGESKEEKKADAITTTTVKKSPDGVPLEKTKTLSTAARDKDEEKYSDLDYCTWSPAEQDDCKQILSRRLFNEDGRVPRRWFFFGDSTVAQLWSTSSLSQVMVDFGLDQLDEACSRRYKCQARVLGHCNLNQQYELNTVPWQLPDWELGQGPSNTTTTSGEACLGCKNCISKFPDCVLIDNDRHCRRSKTLSYGGYIAMPYARDVLLQSPAFATTQENVLAYLGARVNTLDLHEDFEGNPICVVRAGVHDMAIPKMTTAKYVSNVKWYLGLLQPQCSHVVWLQNTAPLLHEQQQDNTTPQFPQTVERVREYDRAVYESVSSSPLRGFVTTMDVFEASIDWTHSDNIHLDSDWNRALGMFFVKLSSKLQ